MTPSLPLGLLQFASKRVRPPEWPFLLTWLAPLLWFTYLCVDTPNDAGRGRTTGGGREVMTYSWVEYRFYGRDSCPNIGYEDERMS